MEYPNRFFSDLDTKQTGFRIRRRASCDIAGDPRLPTRLAAALAENDLVISTASVWELSIKYHLGKLPSVVPLLEDVPGVADQLGASILDITPSHAIRAGALAWAHRDPFDRMLVAQALEDGLRLVSLDERVTAWAGAPLLNWH